MKNRLDIILFGATGFTGKRTIPELRRLINLEGISLTWGVAGRSERKLRSILTDISKDYGGDYNDVPIIIADINDEESLTNMTSRARLIINTVGPYRFYGEPIVKACVATSTHHVDVTGEPQYMETMQLRYHKAATENGIYVISSCGFDSIPADLGVVFLQKRFDGTLNSVETYMINKDLGRPVPGPTFNYATWESAVHGLAESKELGAIRRKLFLNKLPPLKPKLHLRGSVHKNEILNKWAIPFMGADRSVILRSQRHFYENDRKRPVQVQSYFCVDSLYGVFLFTLFGSIFSLFSRYEFTRNLLLKHPVFFSNGTVSHQGPPEGKQRTTQSEVILNGEGWSEKSPDPHYEYKTQPNSKILGKVTAVNPAYGATCTAVVLSAITVLVESDKMPNNGGVYPPGAAFANTSLIEKLHKHGLKFEIVSRL